MSNTGSLAVTGSTTSVADPRSLVLHLEVARLQAELERLEARLGGLRPQSTTEAAPAVDRTDRAGGSADELVDRVVATLLESGRADILDATARRQAEAEADLELARLRAGAIVDAARADLEAALAERGEAVRAAWVRGLDEVDLVEPERPSVPAPPLVWEQGAAQSVASEPVVCEPPLPRTAEMEEARTDAAFDAWMAVGPAVAVALVHVADAAEPPSGLEGGDRLELAPSIARPRSRWLLPLEVAAALLASALLVVLGLVLVG